MLILFTLMLCSLLIVGIILSNKKLYDKGTLFFSVNVTPGFAEGEEGYRIFRAFRHQVWVGNVAALLIMCAGLAVQGQGRLLMAYVIALLVMLIVFFSALKNAKKATLPHRVSPGTKRSAVLVVNGQSQLMRQIVMVPAYVLLLAAMAMVLLQWDMIPERFPQRWDLNGEVLVWQQKSVLNMLKAGIIGLGTMLFVQLVTSPEYRARDGIKQIPLGFGLVLVYFKALLFAVVTLMPLWNTNEQSGGELMAMILLPLILIMIILLAFFSLSWAKDKKGATVATDSAADDPRHWGSIFYNNPDDPAVFVEKQLGLGYTPNMGQPAAKWYALLPVAFLGFVLMMVLL